MGQAGSGHVRRPEPPCAWAEPYLLLLPPTLSPPPTLVLIPAPVPRHPGRLLLWGPASACEFIASAAAGRLLISPAFINSLPAAQLWARYAAGRRAVL